MIELKVNSNGIVDLVDEGGIAKVFDDSNLFNISVIVGVAMVCGKHIESYYEFDEDGVLSNYVFRLLDTSNEEFNDILVATKEFLEETPEYKDYIQNGET